MASGASYEKFTRHADYWAAKLDFQRDQLLEACIRQDDDAFEQLLEDMKTTSLILWRHYGKVGSLFSDFSIPEDTSPQ